MPEEFSILGVISNVVVKLLKVLFPAPGPVRARDPAVTVLLAPTFSSETVPAPVKLTVSQLTKLVKLRSELLTVFVPSYCLLPVTFTDN